MQIVVSPSDIVTGAGTPAGEPGSVPVSWQDYYASSTSAAPLSNWSPLSPPVDLGLMVGAALILLAVVVPRRR